MIQATLQEWATSLGIERRTLEVKLVKNGIEFEKRSRSLTAKQVLDAMIGDFNAEKLRLTSAQAMAVEMENAEKAEVLNKRVDVERIVWEECLSPLRDQLIGYPNTVGVKIKSALQSRGVDKELADEARELACKGVADIVEMIRRPKSVIPKRKESM